MHRVFVLDHMKTPLMPCTPARARYLLTSKQAAVFRLQPFTIILKFRVGGDTQPVQVKFDPGSKTSGLAVVAVFPKQGETVVWAAEIAHRGLAVKENLRVRSACRRARRNRNTGYRKPRFLNRSRAKGWLPPSLMSRVDNIKNWSIRLLSFCPVRSFSTEAVKFDTQALANPEISGVEYQQGTLLGYEVREYLLEKWDRHCSYCGKTEVPLEIEHIHPKSKNGSSRIANLTLACEPCNKKKGNRNIEDFLAHDPERLARILKQCRRPLSDAAAVNATRWAIWEMLNQFGLTVEYGTGGRTKFNRIRQGYEKAHWIDAACVGKSGEDIRLNGIRPLQIKAMGRGEPEICPARQVWFPGQSAQNQREAPVWLSDR
jgi:5-methylcytosine-specific restriction endonuclease McrA